MKSDFNRVYIGIGSNVGDRLGNISAACRALADMLDDFTASSIWETSALIVENQPSFLNLVISGVFTEGEDVLLSKLQAVETSLGRDRSKEISKGPRTMDLDIILYSGKIIKTDTLTIPHPGMLDRSFVLSPLLEIYPCQNDKYKFYKEALDQINDQGVKCLIKIEKGQSLFDALEDYRIE